MTISLIVISDGREDYLRRTLKSAAEMLPEFDEYIWIDDSDHSLGFGGAIRAGWAEVTTDYVFHLEQDFTFNEPVDIDAMRTVLEEHSHLAQLALLRQPWNDHERAAGGVVQLHPESYEAMEWGGHRWLEHTRHFTTNPSLYPASLCKRGWPTGNHSEGHFGIGLFESDRDVRCAYWGDGRELVTHIGDERAGTGY